MQALEPLGDRAVMASFAVEGDALRWAAAVRRLASPSLVDVVQAYRRVAVYFDLEQTTFAAVAQMLDDLTRRGFPDMPAETRIHEIPCCFEYQLDLQRVAESTGQKEEEVICRHTAAEYTVYAIGFCPGFPYLGYLPSSLCGVPRLSAPRLRVEAGSIGLTGRQTGIYTEARPGGWNIIGRTPLELVCVAEGYFPLRTGDRVRFVRIDEAEFRRLLRQRL